jgi:hypothetical protein
VSLPLEQVSQPDFQPVAGLPVIFVACHFSVNGSAAPHPNLPPAGSKTTWAYVIASNRAFKAKKGGAQDTALWRPALAGQATGMRARRRDRPSASARAFPVKTGSPEMLYLFVFTQFRTQNRFPLLLELL